MTSEYKLFLTTTHLINLYGTHHMFRVLQNPDFAYPEMHVTKPHGPHGDPMEHALNGYNDYVYNYPAKYFMPVSCS